MITTTNAFRTCTRTVRERFATSSETCRRDGTGRTTNSNSSVCVLQRSTQGATMIRPDDWQPTERLEQAATRAWSHWRECNPSYPRPSAFSSDRQWMLHYAWHLRSCTSPAMLARVAESVLKRSRGFFPRPEELAAEIAAQGGPPAPAERTTHTTALRWDGREDLPCPACGEQPGYLLVRGAMRNYWAVVAPSCPCNGHTGVLGPSFLLRGIVARAEDDPHALADLERATAESRITEWRRSGRPLADILCGKGAAA